MSNNKGELKLDAIERGRILRKARPNPGMDISDRMIFTSCTLRLPQELISMVRKEAALRTVKADRFVGISQIIREALEARYEAKGIPKMKEDQK